MKSLSNAVFGALIICQILVGVSPAKTLSVILLSNASTQNVIQELLKEYHRQHPEIDFEISIIPDSKLLAKLNTLVTAGQFPDIVEVTTAKIQNYAYPALDLAKYTDRKEFLSRYLPAYQPFIVSGDKVIGVQIEATANGLFYNKDLFAKAGVTVPQNENEIWTWEQFKASGPKGNEASRVPNRGCLGLLGSTFFESDLSGKRTLGVGRWKKLFTRFASRGKRIEFLSRFSGGETSSDLRLAR